MADLTILPTARAIRDRQLHDRLENRFLPRYITMSEFLQRVLVVEGYTRMDDDTRLLMLMEAADFSRFKHLNIERNFFTFTQNASYLFRFFEELSGELVRIDALELADTYGDYAEHLEILSELYERYRVRCNGKKLLDPIFLPELAQINQGYVSTLGEIELIAEGYLTNFEMRVLQECATLSQVFIRFDANQFNSKMQEKFRNLGVEIEERYRYTIDLGKAKQIAREPLDVHMEVQCEPFSERLLQVAFVKQKIYEFVESGIPPERIAVVLPDEGFAEHLRRFDREHNLNFAMGLSLASSDFVQRMDATMAFLEHSSVQNRSRIQRMGTQVLEKIQGDYHRLVPEVDVIGLLKSLIEEEVEEAIESIAMEELFYFEKMVPHLYGASVKSAFHLYLNRLKARSLDDVGGGKVTVMGVLETRLVTFDGVIVIDFNEGNVPRRSEKDLFLNSATRMKAGLPGAEARESLQKLYYHNLFTRAKRVALSYVEATDALPSRFLTQLGVLCSKPHGDEQWGGIIFQRGEHRSFEVEPISLRYDFRQQPISATGLKTFLECRRRYYYRYVEGVKGHEMAREMPREHEIGNALHHALRDVYRQTPHFSEVVSLRQAMDKALAQHRGHTPLEHYLHRFWLRRLEPFFHHEIARFETAQVLSCETTLMREWMGMTLTGQIDRIDQLESGIAVLDYKSGKYPIYTPKNVEKATDFQLEFYYLLAQQKGDVVACGYYDLQSGQIIPESLLETKLTLLQGHLEALYNATMTDFDLTETLSKCRFCDYAHLCGRGT